MYEVNEKHERHRVSLSFKIDTSCNIIIANCIYPCPHSCSFLRKCFHVTLLHLSQLVIDTCLYSSVIFVRLTLMLFSLVYRHHQGRKNLKSVAALKQRSNIYECSVKICFHLTHHITLYHIHHITLFHIHHIR